MRTQPLHTPHAAASAVQRTRLVVTLLVATLLWPTATLGQSQLPAPAGPAGDQQLAKREFERGIAALKAGRHQEAIEALNESYRNGPTSLTLYNLGLGYQSLGNAPKAVEIWEQYLQAADPNSGERQTIDAVKREMERIKSMFARFELSVEPASAQIFLDAEAATPVNNELWVEPGSRRIQIVAPGFEDFEQSLVVQSGRFSLDIKLRRPQGTPQQVALALLTEGEGLLAAGNKVDGVARLEKSYLLDPTPRTAGVLGLAQEEMGRLGRAEELVEKALETRNDPWVSQHKKELRLARRRLTGKGASLFIMGDSAGAEVTVNGRVVGKLPLPGGGKIRVGEGPVAIRAHLSGYDPYTQDLNVQARTEVRLNVLMYKKKPVPVVTVLVPIMAWPEAAPVVVAPPPPPPVEPEPEPEKKEGLSQADIEALADGSEGEPPEEGTPVEGLELNIDFGYLWWVDNKLSNSTGGIASRLFSVGYRPHWVVSFGAQIVGGQVNLWTDNTDVVSSAVVGGLYVRLHAQPERKKMTWDIWGGSGFQPVSMHITAYDAPKVSASDVTADTTLESGIKNEIGLGDTVTLQTVNVPIDLGFTWYFTETFGLTANAQLMWWLPMQQCFHDASDKVCYEDDLDTLMSFYAGIGFGMLP